MSAIKEHIINFLRDAQYRIGELTAEIDALYNIGEIELPSQKHHIRLQLMMFMEMLYEVNYPILGDDFNHIVSDIENNPVYSLPWTEQKLLDEIEYLRVYSGMAEMPLMSFVPFWTEVINITESPSQQSGGGGINVTGNPGQMLKFNASSVLVAIDVDRWAGMRPFETINSYFAGRP
jgi:hypothetical protein